MNPDDYIAPPPDAGGHLGLATRPADLRQVRGHEASTALHRPVGTLRRAPARESLGSLRSLSLGDGRWVGRGLLLAAATLALLTSLS